MTQQIPIGALAQNYAVTIEHILCNIFNCERFGYAGIVNSDFIRRQPFTAILSGLSFKYATADGNRRTAIERFITDYSFFSEMSLDTILSFETNSLVIDGVTYGIDFENGGQAVERIIEDFRAVTR